MEMIRPQHQAVAIERIACDAIANSVYLTGIHTSVP